VGVKQEQPASMTVGAPELPLPSYPALQLPYAAGTSPFRARGLLYQGAIDYWDILVPGGVTAVRQSLPADLRSFFSQMFVPSLLFDALPIVALSAHVASMLRTPHLDMVRDNARWLAERDIRGVHKLLLGVLSPQIVATRLPKAALRYFDFGRAEATLAPPNRCTAQQFEIPAYVVPWFVACVEGFVPFALQKARAKAPRVRCLGATRASSPITPVTISFEFSWV
jgi:hypothetical protein